MHHFAAETLHHEQRNGCTISNGHDAPRPAVSMHHPSRRIHQLAIQASNSIEGTGKVFFGSADFPVVIQN